VPVPAPAAGSGFFGWVKKLFGAPEAVAPAPVAAPVPAPVTVAPVAAPTERRDGRRGERGERGERGGRNRDGGRGGRGAEAREGREPREPRESREAREARRGERPSPAVGEAAAGSERVDRAEREPRRGPRPERAPVPQDNQAPLPLGAEADTTAEAAEGERDGRRRRRRGGRDRSEGRSDEAVLNGGNGALPAEGEALGAAAAQAAALPVEPDAERLLAAAEAGVAAGDGESAEGERRSRRGRGGRGRREPRESDGSSAEAGTEAPAGAAVPAEASMPMSDAPATGHGTEAAPVAPAASSLPPAPERATTARPRPHTSVRSLPPRRRPKPPCRRPGARSRGGRNRLPAAPQSAALSDTAAPKRRRHCRHHRATRCPPTTCARWPLPPGSSGCSRTNEKIRAVQQAMANEPAPIRVPRAPRPAVRLDEGPLVMVETRKDLGQIRLPFETGQPLQ
jgi:ribonuclease E